MIDKDSTINKLGQAQCGQILQEENSNEQDANEQDVDE